MAFARDFNPLDELKAAGFIPTSGYRTQGHQNSLIAQGLTKTKSSSHTRGDGLDVSVPKGMTKAKAIEWAKQKYPGVKAEASNGNSIHLTFPGWGKAPDVSGSRRRYGGR